MAKIRMIITTEFEQPTTGLYASWTAQEQRRVIKTALARFMPNYINAVLSQQGITDDAAVTVELVKA